MPAWLKDLLPFLLEILKVIFSSPKIAGDRIASKKEESAKA